MRISFYNTQNIVVPTLEAILLKLNASGHRATAYFSYASYQNRTNNRISDFVEYAQITYLTKSRLRLNQLAYILSATFKILFSRKTKHIFLTQPPLAYLWFAFICRVFRKSYAIHIMDQYPELLPVMGLLSPNAFLYKFFIRSRTKAFKGADFIIVLGKCMQDLVEQAGIPKEDIYIVKNVPSVNESKPLESTKGGSGFKVLYAGNMGMAHLFSTILESSKSLAGENIHFTFIGKGQRRIEIEQFIKSEEPLNVELLGYLEKEEFEKHLSAADIHFISLRKGFEGLMVPSKLYSSLAVGKPILYEGPANSEIALEIKKYGFGKSISPEDTDGLIAAIMELYDSKDAINSVTRHAISYFKNYCNQEKVIHQYFDIIERNWVQ